MVIEFHGREYHVMLYGMARDRLGSISTPRAIPFFWVVEIFDYYHHADYGSLWNMQDESCLNYHHFGPTHKLYPDISRPYDHFRESLINSSLDEINQLFRHAVKTKKERDLRKC